MVSGFCQVHVDYDEEREKGQTSLQENEISPI